jgi:hypothetical protein
MITTETLISLAKSHRLDWHCRHRQRTMGKEQPVQSKTLRSGTHLYSGLEIKT